MKKRRMLGGVSILGLLLALAPGSGAGSISPSGFDGDGYADLAIGVPLEDVESVVNAGAANVLYGSASAGLTASGDQYWHQDVTGVDDVAENGDRFGSALAAFPMEGCRVYLPLVMADD